MNRVHGLCAVLIALASGQAQAQSAPQLFPGTFEKDGLLTWLTAQTDLRPQNIVSIGASDVIALESRTTPDAGDPKTVEITIHAEVVSAAVAEREGYRSWTGRMRVDCAGRGLQVMQITNFAERSLKGAARPAPVDDDWLHPRLGSQLYSVVRAACDPGLPGPFGEVSVAANDGAEAPPVAATGVQAAATAVASASDLRTATAAGVGSELQVPTAPRADGAAVQISAAGSERLAQAEIARVTARFSNGRNLIPRVEAVVIGGKTLYRARLGGFESVQDAQEFCQALKGAEHDCFVSGGRS